MLQAKHNGPVSDPNSRLRASPKQWRERVSAPCRPPLIDPREWDCGSPNGVYIRAAAAVILLPHELRELS